MSRNIDCSLTDRLCLSESVVQLDEPFFVIWPTGQIPSFLKPSDLQLNLYSGDLLLQPQSFPCNISKSALLATLPLNLPLENIPNLLKTKSSTFISSKNILTSEFPFDKPLFVQLVAGNNLQCLVGPFNVNSIDKTTSFQVSTPPKPSPTVSSSPSPIPASTEGATNNKLLGLYIGIGVIGFTLFLVLILFALYQRRKTSYSLREEDPELYEMSKKSNLNQVKSIKESEEDTNMEIERVNSAVLRSHIGIGRAPSIPFETESIDFDFVPPRMFGESYKMEKSSSLDLDHASMVSEAFKNELNRDIHLATQEMVEELEDESLVSIIQQKEDVFGNKATVVEK